ncbi:type 4b pilus protein PilO2 [Pseudomonas sp. F1002]|uniref:type 4b pilus protein PilO2 n=1 Tax=Pseudomonas sp. F1002 TaxID=2738821 RepID=UPI0015A2C329|nr:type 4b pilus protein PilO2 [Pseudomonas sp. F1002]NWB63508.1 type 4b pilus protein PilO2 [Pseudomonas sp. F1002]
MLARVEIPGFGQALAGLDWLAIPGMDGRRTEIKALGRGVDAAWEFVWTVKGEHGADDKESVALVIKSESKKRPVAAASLVRAAIHESSFITLIEVSDQLFWIFAITDGMPGKGMDRVGDLSEVMGVFKDFINTLTTPDEMPVYTNKQEVLPTLNFQMDVRNFSLEILGHSIAKRDFSKAAFKRHTSAPVIPIVIGAVLIALGCAYHFYQLQAEETARRDSAQIRERAIAKRKEELAAAVSTALNSTVPVRIAIPAYLGATQNLSRLVEGWKLTSIECEGQGCTLTYAAQAFATWAGYLKAKPAEWPMPSFDADINKVTQPISVQFPDRTPRSAEVLPSRDRVRFDLGNLAQVAKNLALELRLPSTWNRVAGSPALGNPDEQWVPVAGDFNASGSAVLLKDLAARLPDTSDVSSVTFKLDEPVTFELKGKAYANP